MVMHAFERVIPGGQVLVSVGLVLFAYSTMVAWAYYGEKCAEYFLGAHCIPYYRVLYTFLVIPGAILDLDLVWDIADISNACMVVPNVIALFALRRVIMRESRRLYEPG
jgi:AGCS family alanine or glycine:cation symporter